MVTADLATSLEFASGPAVNNCSFVRLIAMAPNKQFRQPTRIARRGFERRVRAGTDYPEYSPCVRDLLR